MQARFFTFLPYSWCKQRGLGLETVCKQATREGWAAPALMATSEGAELFTF